LIATFVARSPEGFDHHRESHESLVGREAASEIIQEEALQQTVGVSKNHQPNEQKPS
jgi:hypothetical protein